MHPSWMGIHKAAGRQLSQIWFMILENSLTTVLVLKPCTEHRGSDRRNRWHQSCVADFGPSQVMGPTSISITTRNRLKSFSRQRWRQYRRWERDPFDWSCCSINLCCMQSWSIIILHAHNFKRTFYFSPGKEELHACCGMEIFPSSFHIIR